MIIVNLLDSGTHYKFLIRVQYKPLAVTAKSTHKLLTMEITLVF